MLSARFAVATLPRISRLATRPVIARAYHEKVISHYERPRNVCSAVAEAFFRPLSDNRFLARRWVRSPKVTQTSVLGSSARLRM